MSNIEGIVAIISALFGAAIPITLAWIKKKHPNGDAIARSELQRTIRTLEKERDEYRKAKHKGISIITGLVLRLSKYEVVELEDLEF